MHTVSRTIVTAVALFALFLTTASESVADRTCNGRRCKRPVTHAPAKPAPHTPSGVQPTRQCVLPVNPPLDLRRCDRRGHGQARTEYNCDVKKGMDLIDATLAQQASMPAKMCRLLMGELRNNCCKQLRETAIARCQQGVAANAYQDRKCGFTPPCRRKLLCLKNWIIEEKRSQCCTALKPQGVDLLKSYCEIRVNALTATCSATIPPKTPIPGSTSVGILPVDGYVTIQPVGTVIPLDPERGSSIGPLPDRQDDGSTSAE